MNGNQAGLGQEALFKLLERMPALQAHYATAIGRPFLVGIEQKGYIQITIEFEGAEEPPKSLTARLPPGEEGVLRLKINSERIG